MSDKNNTVSGGVGVVGLLGVAFVILKLCNIITWSWWWVLCPFWAGLAIVLFLVVMTLLFALGAGAFEAMAARSRRQESNKTPSSR